MTVCMEPRIEQECQQIHRLKQEIGTVVVGQSEVIDRVLVGLLAGGHILLEGVPGLAKTLTFRTLARCLSAEFQRIQFTPDLLPADLLGTTLFNPRSGEFSTRRGPIFANLILADEINRAPAKVQSALLEAMQERQVSLGDTTYPLPDPFLVLATQNPIEQEGTYPLPEAQVDRFMLKVRVGYPSRDEESSIIDRMTGLEIPQARPVMGTEELLGLRRLVPHVYLDSRVKNYILDLVTGTRSSLPGLVSCGASPRASIALAQTARAHALLRGRNYVTPDDVKAIGHDVLRHRIIPSYEAEAEGLSSEDLVARIFSQVQVP